MKKQHILVYIALCGLIASSVGITINTAGVFYTSIANDFGVGRGAVSLTITILALVGSFVALFVPKITNERSLKKIILVATILLAAPTALQSLCRSVYPLYALSVLRGIGSGLTNFVLVTMILNQWFFAKKGLLTSLVVMFSGVPGVILSPIFTSIITSYGWQTAYLVMAALIVIVNIPALVFPLSIKPSTIGVEPYGYEEYLKAKQDNKTVVLDNSKSFSYTDPIFILAIIFSIMTTTAAALPQHFPGYAESIGKSASLGALMLSFSMAFNIGSKLLFGVLTEKIGTLKTILTLLTLSLIGLGLLVFVTADITLLIGSGMFCFTFAISSVGVTLVATDLMGMENYNRTYPIMTMVGGIFNAIYATMIGVIYDMSGSYMLNFGIVLVMQLCVLFSLLIAYRMKANRMKKA